jgi:cyanophycinase
MTGNQLGVVLDYLRRSTALRGEGDRTDGQLLDDFTATGDHAAFEALVRRHGPLVLSVCRSVLGNEHDSEDAFQATFLVLVKKAQSISKRESVRSWLYGVAHRVAVRARMASAKRSRNERQIPSMTFSDPSADSARQEIGRLLHEEVLRLPERYRLPVLLCCLEGKSRQDAARELGWTEQAVKGRLERGRKRLHAQLARRGLTLPAALVAMELTRSVVPACVPLPLVAATTRAAALYAAGQSAAAGLIPTQVMHLTEGVLQNMFLTKLRTSAVLIFALTVAGVCAGWLSFGGLAGKAVATSLPAKNPKLGARPDEPILGLVPPRDANRPGKVMLHGGGYVTDAAFARFIQLAGGRQARIVLVPSAGYGRGRSESRGQFLHRLNRRFSSWVRLAATRQIKKLDFLHAEDDEADDEPAFVRPLTSATGVWFSGGDQERLNYRYVGYYPQQTRFQAAVREVVRRGGIVGGSSAGMAVLPEIMTLDQDRDDDEAPYSALAAHGLGLFNGAIVEQHFDSRNGRQERFTGLLRDAARLDDLAERRGAGVRMLGLAVESSTALILQADRLETIGRHNAHVFIKATDNRTMTWHMLRSGDRTLLKRDARGQVVLAAGP